MKCSAESGVRVKSRRARGRLGFLGIRVSTEQRCACCSPVRQGAADPTCGTEHPARPERCPAQQLLVRPGCRGELGLGELWPKASVPRTELVLSVTGHL